jgi:hypothetical protein
MIECAGSCFNLSERTKAEAEKRDLSGFTREVDRFGGLGVGARPAAGPEVNVGECREGKREEARCALLASRSNDLLEQRSAFVVPLQDGEGGRSEEPEMRPRQRISRVESRFGKDDGRLSRCSDKNKRLSDGRGSYNERFASDVPCCCQGLLSHGQAPARIAGGHQGVGGFRPQQRRGRAVDRLELGRSVCKERMGLLGRPGPHQAAAARKRSTALQAWVACGGYSLVEQCKGLLEPTHELQVLGAGHEPLGAQFAVKCESGGSFERATGGSMGSPTGRIHCAGLELGRDLVVRVDSSERQVPTAFEGRERLGNRFGERPVRGTAFGIGRAPVRGRSHQWATESNSVSDFEQLCRLGLLERFAVEATCKRLRGWRLGCRGENQEAS